MQREKLYNLLRTAFFIVAIFAFKMVKILSDQISTVRKRYLFWHKMNQFFSYFIFLSPDILHLKTTKYTIRCSVKSSIIYTRLLVLQLYFSFSKSTKTLSHQISMLRKSHFSIHDECVFSLFITSNLLFKKTKYITRCSIKSSTICIGVKR